MGQDQFHIHFERTGGFMGMSTQLEILSKNLPDGEVENLKSLIVSSCFFDVDQEMPSTGLPDQFQYKLMIDYKGKQRTLEFSDSNMPEKFHPLIRHLVKMARTRKPGESPE